MTDPSHTPQRHIPFEDCFNFRDLGGYSARGGRRIAWGRLFRSSEIHGMTRADGEHALRGLGVKTVIDLRQPSVAARGGSGPLAPPAVRLHNIALISDTDTHWDYTQPRPATPMSEEYIRLLGQPHFGAGIVEALTTIAEPGALPAVVHCSAGKDRTGLLAAVLLGTLGVADEDIVSDYALSARYMGKIVDHWWEVEQTSPQAYFQRMPPFTYDARPETMEHVLTTLRAQHGSMLGYIERHGGGRDLVSRLEAALLE